MSTGTLRRHRRVVVTLPKPSVQPDQEPTKPPRAAPVEDKKRVSKKSE